MVNALIDFGVLKTPRIIEAFRQVPRSAFITKEFLGLSELDKPLPIGHGQTISQPWTVAFMLELLDPQPGQRVLEIGAGSGWVSALLGSIIGPSGTVYGVEIVYALYESAKQRLESMQMPWVTLIHKDGSGGLPEYAPYDRIIGSAAAPNPPEWLSEQLKADGTIVFPVGSEVLRIRPSKTAPRIETFPYFAFVPLLGKHGYPFS